MTMGDDVFLSYHWRDREAVETVARALRERGLSVFLDRWYLVPGRPWQQVLEEKTASCRAVAVFIGPEGLGRWQQREKELALDRQARDDSFPVIPVLLPGADPALGFLGLNTWVDLRAGVHDTVQLEVLAGAIRGEPPGPDVSERVAATLATVCPYRGLRPFREEDEPFFFGREPFTERLAAAVERESFIAVVGASGSGKSSVVRAGLVPRLRRLGGDHVWDVAMVVPGERPLRSLASSILSFADPGFETTPFEERTKRVNSLARDLGSGEVGLRDLVMDGLREQAGTDRLLLVVDQWEELYTLCEDSRACQSFTDQVLDASEAASLTVVLTMRGDFFGQALSHRALADRMQDATVNLGPMTREELRRAVEKPATQVGLDFQDGLVDRILEAVGDEPGNLPLLEFVLSALWEARQGNELLHAAYNDMGELQGAMAQKADEVFDRLSPLQQEIVRRVTRRLVQLGEGTEATRRRARLSAVDEASRAVVQRLADARLVVTGRDETGEETVEVAHEALIRNWDRLRQWVIVDREILLWKQRLAHSITEWERAERDDALLLRGPALAEAERWVSDRPDDIDEAERGFIRAGAALRRRRKVRIGAAAIIFVVALSGVWWAVQRSEQRRDRLAALEVTFRGDIDTDVRASYRALLAMVQDYDGPREGVLSGAVLDRAVALFVEGPLASDTVQAVAPSGELDLIESTYPAFMASREGFGAIAYRLEDIAARNDDLRERATALREGVRKKFIETHGLPDLRAGNDPLNKGKWIEPDSFQMGSPAGVDPDERLQHRVHLSGFFMQEHEVTNEEYHRFDPARSFEPGQERHPVVLVNWYEAMGYAAWLGGSLPTEAQWEFAARGPNERPFPWVDGPDQEGLELLPADSACQYAIFRRCDGLATVKSAKLGPTPEGIYDLAGNVWEWVGDWYGDYQAEDSVDPRGAEYGTSRVLRGGSFFSQADYLRASDRGHGHPEYDNDDIGFRVVWVSAGGQD